MRDGIIGLFPNPQVVKGDLLASVVDETNPDIPGHLDLLNAEIFASNTDAVILEFRLRGDILDPAEGEYYRYSLYFDVDEPYWNHPVDWSDEDLLWGVDVKSSGERVAWGQGVVRLLPGRAQDRIALLARLDEDQQAISARVFADVVHFVDDDSWVQADGPSRMTDVELVVDGTQMTDLSAPDSGFSPHHAETFH